MSIELHIPTLLAILAVSHSINLVFSLVLYGSGQRFQGAKFWVIAQGIMGLGTTLISLRGNIPDALSIGLANTLVIAACLLFSHAGWVYRFKKQYPSWVYGLLLPFSIIMILLLGESVNIRAVVFSIALSAVCFFAFYILVYRVTRAYKRVLYISAIPFAIIGLVNLIRIPASLFSPASRNLMDLGAVTAGIFLLSIATAFFTMFGYFMLSSGYFEQRLIRKARMIRKRNESLRELSMTKDIFLSIIAHDLRGPIGGMSRYVKRHLVTGNDDVQRHGEAVRVLSETLDRTYGFLENLLWWAKSQRHDFLLNPECIAMRELVLDVLSLVKGLADEKDITLGFSGNEMHAFGDLLCLRMVIQNLVSNAIKYGPRDSIVRLALSQDGGRVLFSVRDEGRGMSAEELAALFRIDQKAQTRGSEGELGSGLGLILSRSFAERNNCQLWLESVKGKGTIAFFSLPEAIRP